jgi:RNA polymerase sigma-70 factor (ECF subfamily)
LWSKRADSPIKMPDFKSTLSQADLIQGCIRNDRRVQEVFYKQYCDSMLALCLRYAKRQEDAIEVLQDGFLKIFQQIQRYDSNQSTLYTWMRTIMVRTAIDSLRRGKHEWESIELNEHHDTSIEAEAMQKMSSQETIHLIEQLPETTKIVFNLFIIEGYTHREIGELLNVNEGTSRWHLSEARKYLFGSIKKKERA